MKFAKTAAAAFAATLLVSVTGCSTVADLHTQAEAKRENPTASFERAHENEVKRDPMGWGENNQNGE